MKASKETIERENKMVPKIKLKRVNYEAEGFYDIELTNRRGKRFYGVIDDIFIQKILRNYRPYIDHEKYKA